MAVEAELHPKEVVSALLTDGEALECPFEAGEPAGMGVLTTNTIDSNDTRAIPSTCEDYSKNTKTGIEPDVPTLVPDNWLAKSKAHHTKDTGIHVVRKVIKMNG